METLNEACSEIRGLETRLLEFLQRFKDPACLMKHLWPMKGPWPSILLLSGPPRGSIPRPARQNLWEHPYRVCHRWPDLLPPPKATCP